MSLFIIELFGSCETQVIAKKVPGKWFFVADGARFHGFYLGIPYKGGTLKALLRFCEACEAESFEEA